MKRTEVARQRLVQTSGALLECSDKAALYAKCVTASKSPKPQECEKEFNSLKLCMKNAMKKQVK